MTTIINNIEVGPIESAAFDLYEQGYGVLFGRPGGKSPYDPRPIEAVHAAGLKSGIYATWTTPEQIHTAFQIGEAQGISLNVGVRCGMNRLAVIDVDTAAALRSLSDLATEAGATPLPLTTKSPGKQGPDGEWLHRGGGHVWLRMPADFSIEDLPATVSLTTGENAADQVDLKLDSWVLIPPSVRAEGPYTWAGEPYAIYDAPEWLLERLEQVRQARTAKRAPVASQRRTEDSDELDERIAEWAETLDIPDLLIEAGWHSAGVNDTDCGCEVWTRPGYRQSERSAILHAVGCKHNDRSAPSFHLWTTSDNSEIGVFAVQRGITRLSPLHLVAAVWYGGDMSQAMRWEGLMTQSNHDDDDEDFEEKETPRMSGNLAFMLPAPTPVRPAPAVLQPAPVQPVSDETLSPTPAVPRIPVTPTATDDEFWNTVIFTGDAEEVWDAAGHFDDPRLEVLGVWTAGMILTDPETHQWAVTAGQIMQACPMIDPREVTALVEHGGVTDRPEEFFDWLLAVA